MLNKIEYLIIPIIYLELYSEIYPMSTIQVITPVQYGNEVVLKNASQVLAVTQKKDVKVFKGTSFLNARWTIPGTTIKGVDGWFLLENIPLTNNVADPSDKKDKRNDFEGTRLQFETRVSQAGDFGKFLTTINPEYKKQIADLMATGKIPNKKVMSLLNEYYSDSTNTPAEIRGKLKEDAGIRFKLDFGTYSQNYPVEFLRGKQVTVIRDARTGRDVDGKRQYDLATVEVNGKQVPVDASNLHLFVNRGSVLVKARVHIPSVANAQGQVSIPIEMTECVIMPGTGGGFSDEADDAPVHVPDAAAVPAPAPGGEADIAAAVLAAAGVEPTPEADLLSAAGL